MGKKKASQVGVTKTPEKKSEEPAEPSAETPPAPPEAKAPDVVPPSEEPERATAEQAEALKEKPAADCCYHCGRLHAHDPFHVEPDEEGRLCLSCFLGQAQLKLHSHPEWKTMMVLLFAQVIDDETSATTLSAALGHLLLRRKMEENPAEAQEMLRAAQLRVAAKGDEG